MTPAERLLKAAEILEKRASEATEGPWQADDGCVFAGDHGHLAHIDAEEPYGDTDADADYIATMHPEVGKAVAAWLRDEGSFAQRGLGYQRRAEEVADLVLAGEQEQVER